MKWGRWERSRVGGRIAVTVRTRGRKKEQWHIKIKEIRTKRRERKEDEKSRGLTEMFRYT